MKKRRERRDFAAISNDISEGFRVTKEELMFCLSEERRLTQHHLNRANNFQNALLSVGFELLGSLHDPSVKTACETIRAALQDDKP